eukprot:Tamp_13577.p3 GENE.Tamp_13577~~Tamp_13577.p3  ORF type:complete len:215 (-),score=33.07 Tamp_13577:357-1001(-)
MTESAVLSPTSADCCKRVDEVWVPTQFHVDVLRRAGVPAEKVVAIPEAVDSDFWRADATGADSADVALRFPVLADVLLEQRFVLLSVFKWEHRKGWDVLLDAYWCAFGPDDPVTLVLRSHVPSWESGPASVAERVRQHARVPSRLRSELWSKCKLGAGGLPLPTRLEHLAPVVIIQGRGVGLANRRGHEHVTASHSHKLFRAHWLHDERHGISA